MEPATMLLGAALVGGLAWAASKQKPSPAPEPEEDDSANKDVDVLKAQRLLMTLGQKIGADGKFGPKTSQAWTDEADARGLPPVVLASLGAAKMRVNDRAAMGLAEAAAAAEPLPKPKPGPAPAPKPKPKPAPAPAPKPAPKPAPDPLEADAAAARRAAEQAKAKEDALKGEKTKPAPAPKPKPAPAVALQKVAVGRMQEILARLTAVTVDGLWGPKTEAAWKAEATERGLDARIQKMPKEKNSAGKLVDVAQVAKATLAALNDVGVKAERAANKPAPAPTPAPGPKPKQARHELINNAINALDFNTPKTPAGVRKSVEDLVNHWFTQHWNKGKRGEDPAKLDSYAQWYTRAWRMSTPATQALVPHPKTIDRQYIETPTPKPAPSAQAVAIPVLRAQELLNRHGAGLKPDGLFGQITAGAWSKLATQHKLSVRFERIDGKQVRVDAETLRKLDALPASSKATPPAGYDRAKAKNRARDVSAHLKQHGRAYDKSVLKSWQVQAGLDADGLYGPHSRNALVYYGATDAPAPFVKGTERPYTPPA